MIRRIKVCLNGARDASEHPAVPLTPAQSAASAVAAVAAGAEAVHLHPRDAGGRESLRGTDVGEAVRAVRRAGVPVGVSTGLWITDGDVRLRRTQVESWAELPTAVRPDFASVNVGEPGFGELAGILTDAGIAVEAGVWSVADAEALAGMPPVARILVEIFDLPAEPAADEILARLDDLGVPGPRLLHGENRACWPSITHAGRLRLPTRVGLEDTLTGPAGMPVQDNADLVRLALGAWGGAAER